MNLLVFHGHYYFYSVKTINTRVINNLRNPMSVIILTKPTTLEYESIKLLQSFIEKNIEARVCQFKNFTIVINKGIFYNGEKIKMPKIVLVRLGAGISKAQMAVIRYFELNGVLCINSSDTINVVQDKFYTSGILSKNNIAVPTTTIVKHPITNNLVNTTIGFPCILKIIVGSFGEGVHLCNTEQDFHRVLDFISALDNNKTIIAQEYINDRPGEDLRVLVVGGKVLGAMKRTAPKGDFRANITIGGTGENYPLTDEIIEIAVKSAELLGLDIAGIDLLFDKRGFRVCEANSNPGFLGFDRYCNVNVADSIVEFIASKLS